MSRALGCIVAVVAFALVPAAARADWQLKPFGGVTFARQSPFVDVDHVSRAPKFNLGVSSVWQGEIFGVEGDIATTSGFFRGELGTIIRSHVATFTGNVVVALPRRMAEYSLRPYAVAGAGVSHVSFSDGLAVAFSDAPSIWDVGGGVTGFVSRNVGVNWDLRRFQTIRSQPVTGQVVEEGKLSFWRATMGFTIRM